MKKLYTVSVEFDYVVAADDKDHAQEVARDWVMEAMKDLGTYDLDYTINPGVTAYGYTDDCLPYGGDGKLTIGNYGETSTN